jgi:hypothetical protein
MPTVSSVHSGRAGDIRLVTVRSSDSVPLLMTGVTCRRIAGKRGRDGISFLRENHPVTVTAILPQKPGGFAKKN